MPTDAGKRIQNAFQYSPADLATLLRFLRLNAMTALAMMFQNLAALDVHQAAEESITLLFQEAGGHCQDAGLNELQREQFMEVHHQAAADFHRALNEALASGIPATDCGG